MASVYIHNEKLFALQFKDSSRKPVKKTLYRKRKSFYKTHGLTKAQAKTEAWELEKKHRDGEIDLWSGVGLGSKVSDLKSVFESYYSMNHQKWADSTKKNKKELFATVLSHFGNAYIEHISGASWNTYINQGRFGYKSKKKEFVSLLLKHAEKHFFITPPEIELLATREERNLYADKDFKTFLVEEQVLEIAEYVRIHLRNEQLAYYFLLLFYIPRRRSDFLNLDPEWIHENFIILGDENYTSKAGRVEIIEASAEGMQLMNLYIKKYPNTSFKPRYVTGQFKKAVRKLYPDEAEKLSLHKLRDSGIMYSLHIQNMSIVDMMNVTGHSKLSSLEKYLHKGAKFVILSKKKDLSPTRALQIKNAFFEVPQTQLLTIRS